MDEKKKVVIIVPCYNEESALPLFYDEITKTLKQIDFNYELFLSTMVLMMEH